MKEKLYKVLMYDGDGYFIFSKNEEEAKQIASIVSIGSTNVHSVEEIDYYTIDDIKEK